jgi:hypothetical protein
MAAGVHGRELWVYPYPGTWARRDYRPCRSKQPVLIIWSAQHSGERGAGDALFDFPPPSPSPTFIGRLHTPQTPTLDLRGTDPRWVGGGP